MELVRTAALKGFCEVATELNLDANQQLRKVGLSRGMVTNPDQMLPARAVVRLLEDSAEASNCLTFGLRMAERRELADLGMVSLLIAHQSTLREALSVFAQFRNRINSNLMLHVDSYDGMTMLREAFAFDPPIYARQAEDLATAVLYHMCQSVLGAVWQPIAVAFNYDRPPPAEGAVYQRLFSCPVEFGSEFEGILIKTADLDRPNPLSEPALALHARRLIEAMVDPGERSMVQEVEEAISALMPLGRASIRAVADSLGLNIRTLQRRLGAEDATFGETIERIRVREVSRLLANRRLRLTDVAHQLGYASLSAFSRWYGERFNETASEGRRKARHEASAMTVKAVTVDG